MRIRITRHRNNNYSSSTLHKSPSYNFNRIEIYNQICEKVHRSQVSNGNKNRLDHESFHQSNIETLFHLNPDDCKNDLKNHKRIL